MRKFVTAIAALTALVATAANAHPKLVAASPAAGAVVSGSPSEIRITFSEAVFPKLCGVTLTDDGGHAAPTGKASVNPDDKRQLIVPIVGTLAPGHYKVMWKAVSADTHRVQGQFAFSVK